MQASQGDQLRFAIGLLMVLVAVFCFGRALVGDLRLWLDALRDKTSTIPASPFIFRQSLLIAIGFMAVGVGLVNIEPDIHWLLPYWFVVGIVVVVGTSINSYIRIKLRNNKANSRK